MLLQFDDDDNETFIPQIPCPFTDEQLVLLKDIDVLEERDDFEVGPCLIMLTLFQCKL